MTIVNKASKAKTKSSTPQKNPISPYQLSGCRPIDEVTCTKDKEEKAEVSGGPVLAGYRSVI